MKGGGRWNRADWETLRACRTLREALERLPTHGAEDVQSAWMTARLVKPARGRDVGVFCDLARSPERR